MIHIQQFQFYLNNCPNWYNNNTSLIKHATNNNDEYIKLFLLDRIASTASCARCGQTLMGPRNNY